ncbi:TolC family outer membrane protein [Fodinicurvata sp. EGI_FJ10296]|uniref:TolC family outer membrane protein n=1 Tax=Fodinicurvata sp. EGI_FJ10296 TaxID=3231908 RepID=UPI0034526607
MTFRTSTSDQSASWGLEGVCRTIRYLGAAAAMCAAMAGSGTFAATGIAFWALSGSAQAQTLQETLAETYRTNPDIRAERANLRATNEDLSQALAGYRPTIQGEASVTARSSESPSQLQPGRTAQRVNPAEVGISLSQPLYRGGRTVASVEQAEAVIQARRAALADVEQSVLLSAVVAHVDLVQARAVLALARNNESVISRQLQATRDRFSVGEVTRTDVSLAESRLAAAESQTIAAEGSLRNARAAYERVVGVPPGEDVDEPSGAPPGIPASLEEALTLAESANPRVTVALFTERAAQAGVDVARGGLLPEVTLNASVSRSYSDIAESMPSDSISLTARLTVPLYQAGAQSSRVRQAREQASQRRIEVESVRRGTISDAIEAWETVATARSQIQSLNAQVQAQQVALNGVREEAQVGERTPLDVLDAEQDLLDAQVDLVEAQRNLFVAHYQLLSSAGRLRASELGLDVDLYDIEPAYQRSRDAWWGTSVPEAE